MVGDEEEVHYSTCPREGFFDEGMATLYAISFYRVVVGTVERVFWRILRYVRQS